MTTPALPPVPATVSTLELPADPHTPLTRPLVWHQTSRTSWRTTDGEYLIMTVTAPDVTDRVVAYQLRHVTGGTPTGYHLEDNYGLEQAMTAAVRHRYTTEHRAETHIREDYPAEQVHRFFWPISDGTTRAALVTGVDEDGLRYAAVVGTSRGDAGPDGECRYQPTTWVSLSID